MVPFLAPIRISRVDVRWEEESKAALFQATDSMTILNVFNCLGFLQPWYRYQFSPSREVITRCRPEGSKNSLYIENSEGFRGMGILVTWSGCASSISSMTFEDNPMARKSEATTRDTRGALSGYWTRPKSNIGAREFEGAECWLSLCSQKSVVVTVQIESTYSS